jgi:hypothetical protein
MWLLAMVAAFGATRSTSAADVAVRKVEAIEGPETLVRIHLSAPLGQPAHAHLIPRGDGQPDRLVVDLPGADLNGKRSRTVEVGWGDVQRMRLGLPTADAARLVLDLNQPVAFHLSAKGSIVDVTLRPKARPALFPRRRTVARSTAGDDRSVMR